MILTGVPRQFRLAQSEVACFLHGNCVENRVNTNMTQQSPASEPEHRDSEGVPSPQAEQDVRTVTEVGALIDQTAHDLRSSLNAIQSWAYVLERAIDQAAASSSRSRWSRKWKRPCGCLPTKARRNGA